MRHHRGVQIDLDTLPDDDGRIEMDANVVERAIRPVALNHRQAPFAGSDGGTRHWAIAMTLIPIARPNGAEPMAWLTDVLARIVSGRTKATGLGTALLWNRKPSSPATIPAIAA